MTDSSDSLDPESPLGSTSSSHRLEITTMELIGGGRSVDFRPGLNIIQGDITTGKTTLIGLIRAMLGTMPKGLPPEVDYVRAIRGRVVLGDRIWNIYRPRTTTRDAPVEVSEDALDSDHEPLAFRLRATGSEHSYSTFMLERLGIPAISVPQARSQPTGAQTPVTMTDWLGYCIITGDELDTEVFGHRRVFRDAKRKAVFELAYGYYDPEIAVLNAKLRSIELRLEVMDREAEIQRRFLQQTPFAERATLEHDITSLNARLEQLESERRRLTSESVEVPGVRELRELLLASRAERADMASRIARLEGQLKDLDDLHRQLLSQSARLTRAIVADEWLIDFDFVVCPRCGSDVEAGRAPAHLCYLCMQEPQPSASRDQLLGEQERVSSQINETADVIGLRRDALTSIEAQAALLDGQIIQLASQLDATTQVFVSDHASQIAHFASEQARNEAEILRRREYLDILDRLDRQSETRTQLENDHDEVTSVINSWELSGVDAEANVRALELRMLEYLRELHIPDLGQELTVLINRTTYMPIVAGRSFDELSSQGLKTLVNIAHALAHHTVAIDRGLPMPGLLVLDGLSANAGFEGFDQDRVSDVYRLIASVAREYEEQLQLVAVDNVLAPGILLQLASYVVLNLTQEDRLIRVPTVPDGDAVTAGS